MLFFVEMQQFAVFHAVHTTAYNDICRKRLARIAAKNEPIASTTMKVS